MNIHKNSKLTVHSRAHLLSLWQDGKTVSYLSEIFGISKSTVYKWLKRFQKEGKEGLCDRSSRPHTLKEKLSQFQKDKVISLRHNRFSLWKIAAQVGVSLSTVARFCKRFGLSRLKNLDPKPIIVRYEKENPGDLIHIDMKKLGKIEGVGHRITGDRTRQSSKRGKGWEVLHLAVDDHSRLAYCEILPDEKRKSCLQFLLNALRFFRAHRVSADSIMTDNGPAFRSKKYNKILKMLKIKHKYTRAYRPQTNGKVERFVQTSLREWAYAKTYQNSKEREKMLIPFLRHYNLHRPHFGIKGKTPYEKLKTHPDVNNLSKHNI